MLVATLLVIIEGNEPGEPWDTVGVALNWGRG